MWRHTLPVVSGPSAEKQEGPHTVDGGSSGGRVKEPGECAGVLETIGTIYVLYEVQT